MTVIQLMLGLQVRSCDVEHLALQHQAQVRRNPARTSAGSKDIALQGDRTRHHGSAHAIEIILLSICGLRRHTPVIRAAAHLLDILLERVVWPHIGAPLVRTKRQPSAQDPGAKLKHA